MKARIIRMSLTGAVALAVVVGGRAEAQEGVLRTAHHDYRVVTVVEGLQHPWSIAFLPSGEMLVTERPGRLRIVRDGVLLPDPVEGLPDVRVGGQGGLLEVVPHPRFESNHLLYISYSKPNADESQGTTAVIRGRFENDRLTEVEELFEAVAWTTGQGHHGSRLVFDRDDYLFVTVGDRMAPAQGELEAHPAQDLTNHHGKTIRLHDDGRVPTDNPFVGHPDALPEIWSYGHRNMQGMIVHPETNEVWQTEHGPQGGDELNLIRSGANYGWPVIGYGVNYRTGSAIHASTHAEGMEQPAHIWVPSIGTSGMLLYTGDRFPAWRGSIIAGGLSGERLALLHMDGGRVLNEERLAQGVGRVRDVRQGPDGLIYLAIDDRGGAPTPIVRLEPVE
jgi:aldose sugar dehydrogenase